MFQTPLTKAIFKISQLNEILTTVPIFSDQNGLQTTSILTLLDDYQDHKTLTQGVVFIPLVAPQGSIIILGFRKLVRFVGPLLFSRKKDKSCTTTITNCLSSIYL